MPKIEVVETLLLLDIVVGINVGRGNRDTGRRVGSGVNGDLVGVVEVDTMTGDAVVGFAVMGDIVVRIGAVVGDDEITLVVLVRHDEAQKGPR